MYLFLISFFLIIPSTANAYIDPGIGSLFLQGLIAGIAVFMTSIAFYYKKIKNFFSNIFKVNKKNERK